MASTTAPLPMLDALAAASRGPRHRLPAVKAIRAVAKPALRLLSPGLLYVT